MACRNFEYAEVKIIIIINPRYFNLSIIFSNIKFDMKNRIKMVVFFIVISYIVPVIVAPFL